MPEWQLPAETASVPLARRLATDALTDVPQRTLEVVALVVSELVTNCLRHAGTDLHLKVTQRPDHVQVEVSDHGRGRPARKSPPPSVAHGRGLQIVQALTRGWGVVPAAAGAGKTVWCSVAI